MSYKDRITKECMFTMDDDDFNDMIEEIYGHIIEINAEETDLYEASIKRSAYKEWKYTGSEKEFNTFKETGKYPGTSTLLTGLCIEGYIEEGTYLIEYGG